MSEMQEAPAVVDMLRHLQTQTRAACNWPQPHHRVGFAFSSKDRPDFTRQTLAALDAEGAFDLVWNDASDEPEARALPTGFNFHNVRLVEVNGNVRGGPDSAICFGLKRLLDLGYDYVGLMENDIVLQPGWYPRMLELFRLAAADGVACGAATVRSFASRVIEHRAGYSLNWATGAGMVLFARPAAEIILQQYARIRMSTASICRFYARLFRLDLRLRSRTRDGKWSDVEQWLTLDWGYSPMLYMHGYASVGSIPNLARDLEFPPGHYLLQDYVPASHNNAGLVMRRCPAA